MARVKKSERIRRDTVAWDLAAKGYTHKRIAEELLLERSTVTKILQRVGERASKELLTLAVSEKARQIEALKYIIDEAMQAWESSKGQEKSATRKEKEGGKGKEIETTQHVEENSGDPRYLAEARAAMADIRKILGLDHPLRLLNLNFGELTDEQVDLIAQGRDPFEAIYNDSVG